MDDLRFDRLTRVVATSSSRRRLLAGLIATVAAGGVSGAEAARSRPCQRLGVQCTRSGQCCTGVCRTQSLPGRWRRQVCDCQDGLTNCRGKCVDLGSDVANCGACGDACGDRGDTCVDGDCACGEGPACGDGLVCLEGACAPTTCSVVTGAWTCLLLQDGTVIDACGTDGINNNGGTVKDCTQDSDCVDNCGAGLSCYCAAGKGYCDSDPEYTPYENGRCIEVTTAYTGSACTP
jgi:hypothetical protein